MLTVSKNRLHKRTFANVRKASEEMESYAILLVYFANFYSIRTNHRLEYFLDECTSQEDSCDRNARCLYNSIGSRYECQCNEGLL